MVLTLTVVVIIGKSGLTKSFLTEDNMAFKINSPFDLSKMSTSVFERDMGEDPVFARTPKNGVIILNENLKDPVELEKTLAHEQVHVDQYKDELKNPGTGLDYEVDSKGAGKVMFKGKEYDYSVMQAGKGPWEKDAYAAERKLKQKN